MHTTTFLIVKPDLLEREHEKEMNRGQ